MPALFPGRSLLAVRIAHSGENEGWTPAFTRAVFAAQFGEGADIADMAFLSGILGRLGVDPEEVVERAGSHVNKESLKARTAEAQARGIFGAPTFVLRGGPGDGELFWGDDRLEQAIRWCQPRRV